jgi:hypothetical protein
VTLGSRVTLVGDGSSADITIRGSNAAAVIITDAQATVSNMTLVAQGFDKVTPAVHMHNGGTLDHCILHADHGPGVVAERGKPLLVQCAIFQGTRGVVIKADTRATLNRCTLKEQELAAVEVERNGQAQLTDCQLSGCRQYGLVTSGRKVTVDNGVIEANGETGVEILDGTVLLNNVQVKDNGNWGMRVVKNASFEINHCAFRDNSQGIPEGQRGAGEMQWKRDMECPDCLEDGRAAPLSR